MRRGTAAILMAAVFAIAGCSREAAEARHIRKANALLEHQDYAGALAEFKSAAREKPLDAEPYYRIGLIYLKLDNPALAAAALKRATELNPRNTDAQVRLAGLMSGSGDRELLLEAEGQMKSLVGRARNNIDALNVLALVEWNLGKKEAAQQHLSEAFAKSANAESAVQLARIRLQNGDQPGAEEILTRAVREQPKSIALAVLLAEFYAAAGKLDEAETRYKNVLAADPDNPKALEELGALYVAGERLDLAEPVYRRLADLPAAHWSTAHAQFLLETGRMGEGIAELETLLARAPVERPPRTLLVAAYIQTGRSVDAERILDRALKEHDDDMDALFQKGLLELFAGRIDRALSRLNAVLASNPDSAEAHYFVGKANQLRGATATYRRELSRALELKPALLAARIDLARELRSRNAGLQALQVMNSTAPWQRNEAAAIAERNWALMATDRKAEMRAEVERGLGISRTPELLVQDAILQLEANRAAAAARSAEEALELNDDSLAALTVLVTIDRAQQQKGRALERVRAYAERHPSAASAQYLLGELLLDAGRPAEAKRAFAAAQKANPEFPAAVLSLASLDVEEGRLAEAQSALAELLARQPAHSDALFLMGAVEERQGRYADAVRRYQAILEWDPTNVPALNNLAYVMTERLHRADEALQYAERAKQASPYDATVDDTFGWVLYRKGLYSMAVDRLKSSVAREASPVRQLHLAMAYFKSGDPGRARGLLEQALPKAEGLPEAVEAQEVIRP
jgi:tetratricopeptide (TPR) repeat protein